jgi:cobalt-zinc-cadmium efflux system outer membrane protein
MRAFYLLPLLVVICMAASSSAQQITQPPEPIPVPLPQVSQPAAMTLQDLEGIALANNPTLVQAGMQIEAARGRWTQAGLYPNPTLSYSGFEIGNSGRAGQQGALIDQQIVRGGKLGLSQATVSQEVTQAQQLFEAQRWRILNDVRLAYYNVLVTQRAMQLSGQLVEIGDQGLATTDRLLNAKEVGRVEQLQSRVEANSAKVALQNAQNRYTGAWRRLVTVLGMPCLPPAPLIGDLEKDLPQLTWEDSLCKLLTTSPEVAAARAGTERARYALRRAQAEPVPNLNLQAGPSYDFATGSTIANVQVGVTLPLHDNNRGNIRAAEAQLRNAQAEVGRVELSLQNRLATAFIEYQNARQQVEQYGKSILPDAKASLDLVAAGYRQGELNYLTMLTAQRTYFQTNLVYLTALSSLWESTVVIEGLLLTNSLQVNELPNR